MTCGRKLGPFGWLIIGWIVVILAACALLLAFSHLPPNPAPHNLNDDAAATSVVL